MVATAHDIGEIDVQLEALLDLDGDARVKRLEAIAADDPTRAAVLRRLLELATRAHTGNLRGAFEAEEQDSLPPPRIAGYEILGVIGRGGMATVYEAQRSVHGVTSTVAIKVLRGRITDPLARERFVREQQILSTLSHPSIGLLLDAGVVDGRTYMVMERIEGTPIDRHLEPGRAPVPAILDAMIAVTDAVQSAHERLVVHRDIKPENVLVDQRGTPKLIDFGIAKILEASAGESASATATGSVPLTLRYASPEQLRAEAVGVGSDIYQLGLLLYRLLTGAWPYDEAESQVPLLRARSDMQAARPSERVNQPARARRLKGDLDAIALRCLSACPEQRYRTARELQLDLQRHLRGEPVQARKHSRRYLVHSFVRRNRLAVLLGLSVLVYTATVTWQGEQLRRERNLAEQARARAEATHGFLLEVVGSADPEDSVNRGRQLDDLLRAGIDRVQSDFAGEPGIAAQLLADLGTILVRRSRYADAEPALRRALELRSALLGPDHRDALSARLSLAQSLRELGRNDEAMREVDAIGAAVARTDGAASLAMVEVLTQAGAFNSALGRHAQAEQGLRQALAIEAALDPAAAPASLSGRSRAAIRAAAIESLGNALLRERRLEEAQPLVIESLALQRAMWGEEDPRTLAARQNSAFLLRQLRRVDEARAELLGVLAVQRKIYGGPHQVTAYTLGHLANLHSDQRDYDAAVALWKEAEAEARAALGDEHPWLAMPQLAQARSLRLGGRTDEAREVFARLAALTGRDDDLASRAATALTELDAESPP